MKMWDLQKVTTWYLDTITYLITTSVSNQKPVTNTYSTSRLATRSENFRWRMRVIPLPLLTWTVSKTTVQDIFHGVELTIENFLNDGYYFLLTTSLFDSKYKGGDGITRNTAFNGNYVFNSKEPPAKRYDT